MPDNKTKKRADRKRVSLKQEHEREYTIDQLHAIAMAIALARVRLIHADRRLIAAANACNALKQRLRSGFPAATKGKGRGK